MANTAPWAVDCKTPALAAAMQDMACQHGWRKYNTPTDGTWLYVTHGIRHNGYAGVHRTITPKVRRLTLDEAATAIEKGPPRLNQVVVEAGGKDISVELCDDGSVKAECLTVTKAEMEHFICAHRSEQEITLGKQLVLWDSNNSIQIVGRDISAEDVDKVVAAWEKKNGPVETTELLLLSKAEAKILRDVLACVRGDSVRSRYKLVQAVLARICAIAGPVQQSDLKDISFVDRREEAISRD